MRLGSIYACIQGDHRYATTVNASLEADGTAVITRCENGAVGGMDGPGGSDPFEEKARITLPAGASGAQIVKAIKTCFDSTITRYGTPAKRFRWHNGALGLSAVKADSALASAR